MVVRRNAIASKDRGVSPQPHMEGRSQNRFLKMQNKGTQEGGEGYIAQGGPTETARIQPAAVNAPWGTPNERQSFSFRLRRRRRFMGKQDREGPRRTFAYCRRLRKRLTTLGAENFNYGGRQTEEIEGYEKRLKQGAEINVFSTLHAQTAE